MMFEYIKGTLISINPHKAVVDVGGVGYLLHIPLSAFSAMPPLSKEIIFYISSVIREDSHKNFGFLSIKERDLFEKISGISGVGPKTALALIGHLDTQALESAITTANSTILSKIPGIGKKTAERLIVELRDKVLKRLKKYPLPTTPQKELSEEDQKMNDALSALMNLGYNSLQAQRALKKALSNFKEIPGLSTLIRSALSNT
ncbi:MAG: Holliday junction branch migration protein RuvA [Candidatus Neptunochlamydia sp.]|nr:Holliday junction branch migration protein RuvA [Candidatus Neptunochlamydia sp.]